MPSAIKQLSQTRVTFDHIANFYEIVADVEIKIHCLILVSAFQCLLHLHAILKREYRMFILKLLNSYD